MKRCTLLLAAGMALACQSTPVLPDPAELTDVVYVQEAAWNDGDLEGFMAGSYWRSDALTFLSGGDWTRGYATVLERYRRRYLEGGAEMGRLSFTDLEAEGLAEDAGLVRGRWTLTFSDGSTTSGLFTLVMRRMFEGWRVVHDHTSVDQPGT